MHMKKNFTIVEIIIVLVIISIVATFAIPAYKNIIEKSKAETCKMNLRVLLGAVETYAIENDELPASLGQLQKKDLEKSWAKILKKDNSWRIKLVYWIVDFKQYGLAYAQEGWIGRYIGDLKYFTCPADETPPPAGHSYGINQLVTSMPFAEYRVLQKNSIPIIADCDDPIFTTTLAKRHKQFTITGTIKYAQEIKKGDEVSSVPEGSEQMIDDEPGVEDEPEVEDEPAVGTPCAECTTTKYTCMDACDSIRQENPEEQYLWDICISNCTSDKMLCENNCY